MTIRSKAVLAILFFYLTTALITTAAITLQSRRFFTRYEIQYAQAKANVIRLRLKDSLKTVDPGNAKALVLDLNKKRRFITPFQLFSPKGAALYSPQKVPPTPPAEELAKIAASLKHGDYRSVTSAGRMDFYQRITVNGRGRSYLVRTWVFLPGIGEILTHLRSKLLIILFAELIASLFLLLILDRLLCRPLHKLVREIRAGHSGATPVCNCEMEIIRQCHNVLKKRFHGIRASMTDREKLTGLPGNIATERMVDDTIAHSRDTIIFSCKLHHLKPYCDCYGFEKGDEIIKTASQILIDALRDLEAEGFIGHINIETFIVIIDRTVSEQFAHSVIEKFDAVIPEMYSVKDRKLKSVELKDRRGNVQRFPFVNIALLGVDPARRTFKNMAHVKSVMMELEEKTRSIDGSKMFVDRRTDQ